MVIPGINPYLLRWGPISIRWYGLFMAISLAVGVYTLINWGTERGADEDTLLNASILSIIGGIVGARVIFVATQWSYFAHHLAMIPRIDLGGISIHGGIGGGILTAWLYLRRSKIPLTTMLDFIVPGLATGVILVRIGNIFNQEILGYHALVFGGARHPAQLYGSAIGLIIWIVFLVQTRRRTADGVRFWTAILVYSVLRFFVEFAKSQNPHYFIKFFSPYWGLGGITMEQWVTPFIIAIAWWGLRRAKRLDRNWYAPGAAESGSSGEAGADEAAGAASARLAGEQDQGANQEPTVE